MTDRKPPRFVGEERDVLLALLQFQRESLVRKVEGVSEEDARRALVPSGTTLLWLMQHISHAELIWIVHRFAGEDFTVSPDAVVASATVAEAVDTYRATWARVDAIVAASSLDDECAEPGDDTPANLRWVLMHLLEETARHAGHADILRELIDGHIGR
jgi:uncharacterized damage-inducible protein DinB